MIFVYSISIFSPFVNTLSVCCDYKQVERQWPIAVLLFHDDLIYFSSISFAMQLNWVMSLVFITWDFVLLTIHFPIFSSYYFPHFPFFHLTSFSFPLDFHNKTLSPSLFFHIVSFEKNCTASIFHPKVEVWLKRQWATKFSETIKNDDFQRPKK